MREWSYVWLICFTRVTLWCAHSKTYRPVTVIVVRDYCLVVDYLCSGRTESRRSWRSLQLDSSFRYSHTCLSVLSVNAKVLSSWWWSRWTLGDLFQDSDCDCKHDCTLWLWLSDAPVYSLICDCDCNTRLLSCCWLPMLGEDRKP